MDVLPLLAFGFASPWVLWGLGLASVPIIIHLLHKRRYREVPWAAMRFLIEAARKNSRRVRLEQLVLLAVRALLVLLLVLALARPFVEGLGALVTTHPPAHRVLVIDASYSMGYQSGEQTRFERAKAVAAQIVGSSRQGDALNLVRISGSQPRVIVSRPTYRAAQLLDEIAELSLPDERAELAATLDDVAALLRDAPEIPRKEVYFLSDFQQRDWLPAGGEAVRIRRALRDLSERAELTFIDVGQGSGANAAVTRFRTATALAIVDEPVSLQAVLHNFGPSTLVGQRVELLVDGRLLETRRVDLPPGTDTAVDFAPAFAAGGDMELEVRLESDPLPADNRRWLALRVRDRLDVLLVNGRPSGRPMQNATDYLQLALAPRLPNQPTPSLIQTQVVSEGELPAVDLARFDCVFLCNVALITDREAELLRAYVDGGGGLVLCLGNQVKADSYNRMLGPDGVDLLPALLTERVGDAASRRQSYGFDTAELEHPIVQPFQGNPNAGLQATRTFEYFATAPPHPDARVALAFETGHPAIIERPVGRGRSVLVTTSVDREWSTWAVWGHSLIPLMHETVAFAVTGDDQQREHLVGEPLVETYPTRAPDTLVTLKLPRGGSATRLLSPAGGFSRLMYDETPLAGTYEAQVGPPLNRRTLFAVNVDPAESDLARLEERDLRSELLPRVDLTWRTQWEETPREAEVATVQRSGLSRGLLVAVLALLLVESVMAWNFFYGFLLLYAAVAAALVRPLLGWNLGWGAAIALLLAAGLAAMLLASRGVRPSVPGMLRR